MATLRGDSRNTRVQDLGNSLLKYYWSFSDNIIGMETLSVIIENKQDLIDVWFKLSRKN